MDFIPAPLRGVPIRDRNTARRGNEPFKGRCRARVNSWRVVYAVEISVVWHIALYFSEVAGS